MSDPAQTSSTKASPPPAPPLPTFPPRRAGVLQRIAETVGLGSTSQPLSRVQTRTTSYNLSRRGLEHIHSYQRPLPSQTTAHKTGIPIAALDINSDKTCAILAGKEILKIVRFEDGSVTEDANLRSNISSTNTVSDDVARRRRDYLPATDVKWSSGNFKNFIATAANHGRIAIYDVSRAEVERAWIHEHTGAVHKLAFDPHIGALLLSGSHDGTVRMWDLRMLSRATQIIKTIGSFLSKKSGVRDVKWCPTQATDALEFALCTDTGVIQKWDLRKPNQPMLSINAHGKACLSIDWHPDGKHLVSGGLDRLVKVWDFYSDKGNQKAKFELKTPQAVRNIRWRPPYWSSQSVREGRWQCTQLATSYHQDDPRVHVWDIRRPYLPLCELERYKNPATDLLWAGKDLIWTVGEEGWFTQTDVSIAPLVSQSIVSGIATWFPDGQYAAFTENILARRGFDMETTEVGFLSVPQKSSGSDEETAVSKSFSDDEAAVEGLLSNSFSRRQSREALTKPEKSQTNTPPAPNRFPVMLSLDKAVSHDTYDNKQIGMVGEVTGLAADPEISCLLSESYATPSFEADRKAHPGSILERLEAAFSLNADICDDVSMHRTAQSWRVLGAVIVPELKAWAEKNRALRLNGVAKQKAVQLQKSQLQDSENAVMSTNSPPGKSLRSRAEIERQERVRGNLSEDLLGAEKHYPGSTSNVTTPMARPLPDSPVSAIHSPEYRYQNLDETLERLPQLPPSLLTSHTTAAAATRALRENAGSMLSSDSPTSNISDVDSSPKNPKYQRGAFSQTGSPQSPSPSTYRTPMQSQALLSTPLTLRPVSKFPATQKQEDRRAALRDYQKQARPLLTFEEPPSSPTPSIGVPARAFSNVSGQESPHQQSFPLFSSSDSSHNTTDDSNSFPVRTLPDRDFDSNSIGSAGERAVTSALRGQGYAADAHSGSTNQADRAREVLSKATILDSRRKTREERERVAYDLTQKFGMDGANDSFKFGMDSITEGHEEMDINRSSGVGKALNHWVEQDYGKHTKGLESETSQTSASSSPPEPFQFDHEDSTDRKLISQPPQKTSNAFRGNEPASASAETEHSPITSGLDLEDMASTDFIFYDFRPIDLTTYNPPTPFAWSAVPLIAQAIAFDLDTGPACAQFSAHLLAHVHPYFFHQDYRRKPTPALLAEVDNYALADRLMHPSFNSRMFDHIYLEYDRYLKSMGMFVQVAEFRKLCTDFGYSSFSKGDATAIEAGLASATPHALSTICVNTDCRAPMHEGRGVCLRCKNLRRICPICLALEFNPGPESSVNKEFEIVETSRKDHDRGLWAYCHGCGHSAHLGCLEDWLAHPFSEGECPTSNCGHDCGPGKTRMVRIAAGVREVQAEKGAKPSAKGIEVDQWRVKESAAVERTRHSLRSLDDRATQSGDDTDRVRSSFGSRSGSGLANSKAERGSFSGRGGQGQRKSVRLVTPSEEMERSMNIE